MFWLQEYGFLGFIALKSVLLRAKTTTGASGERSGLVKTIGIPRSLLSRVLAAYSAFAEVGASTEVP